MPPYHRRRTDAPHRRRAAGVRRGLLRGGARGARHADAAGRGRTGHTSRCGLARLLVLLPLPTVDWFWCMPGGESAAAEDGSKACPVSSSGTFAPLYPDEWTAGSFRSVLPWLTMAIPPGPARRCPPHRSHRPQSPPATGATERSATGAAAAPPHTHTQPDPVRASTCHPVVLFAAIEIAVSTCPAACSNVQAVRIQVLSDAAGRRGG